MIGAHALDGPSPLSLIDGSILLPQVPLSSLMNIEPPLPPTPPALPLGAPKPETQGFLSHEATMATPKDHGVGSSRGGISGPPHIPHVLAQRNQGDSLMSPVASEDRHRLHHHLHSPFHTQSLMLDTAPIPMALLQAFVGEELLHSPGERYRDRQFRNECSRKTIICLKSSQIPFHGFTDNSFPAA